MPTPTNQPSAITVSLELARELKEAGFPHDRALFYYWGGEDNGDWRLTERTALWTEDESLVAAPTSEEVLVLLPDVIDRGHFHIRRYSKNTRGLRAGKGVLHWSLEYHSGSVGITERIEDTLLVNAAAKMYLYLSTNNLL